MAIILALHTTPHHPPKITQKSTIIFFKTIALPTPPPPLPALSLFFQRHPFSSIDYFQKVIIYGM